MTGLPVINYGETAIDFNTVPAGNLRAMLARGVQHYLGSEQASKVGPNSAWVAKFKKENSREPNESELNAQKAANFNAALGVLLSGEVGAGRGPKLDPIEAEIDRIASREVRDILAGAGLCKANRVPKDDDEFTFASGDTFTFEKLVERRIANEKEGPRIKAEAEKRVAAEKKKREAAQAKAKAATEAGPVNVESLGL